MQRLRSILAFLLKLWRWVSRWPRIAIRWIVQQVKHHWLWLWVVGSIVIAQLSLFFQPTVGVYVNATALAGLIGLGLWRAAARDLAISTAIIPVAAMVSLSLPQDSTFITSVLYYDSLLLLALVYRFLFTLDHPLPATSLGKRGYLLTMPSMIVPGQILGVIGYLLLRHQYTFGHTSLPLVAVSAGLFAITEEVLLRGLIQQRATLAMSPVAAAVLSAVLTLSLNFGHTGSWLAPFYALIAGIVLAYTYYRKQNLLLTFVLNVTSKLVYVGLMAAFIFRA